MNCLATTHMTGFADATPKEWFNHKHACISVQRSLGETMHHARVSE